jgi:tartrate dehydrogenase/decarboxylase / D-malate dehydrogenase
MRSFSIAVIAGDGIGLEVMPPALAVLDKLAARHDAQFRYTPYD